MRLSLIFSFIIILTAPLSALAEDAASTPAPQWYIDDLEFLTRDGGRWITSNAEYQDENDTMDAYGIEWKKGYAHSMTGRLFGVKDGKETGNFWEFFQYWDAGKGEAVITQFGFGGAVGLGRLWTEGDVNKTEQAFYAPDGSVSVTGHEASNPDADTHFTQSFNIVDGEWRPRRAYTWKREIKSDKE